MKAFITGKRTPAYSKVFKFILNRLNHSIALKNLSQHPQLVIFSFDHIGLTINIDGRYENLHLQLVENFISEKLPDAKNKTVLDVGANIGNHSVFFSRLFKKVHSFEPNPITYEVLSINAKYAAENRNIECHKYGLSDKAGTVPFLVDPQNIGGSSVVAEQLDQTRTMDVEVMKLDDLPNIICDDIALIKVDVEGHELQVLDGASATIKKHRPVIVFEQQASDFQDDTSKPIQWLESYDYQFYIVKVNFYFGETFFGKVVSVALRSLFGERLTFIEAKQFRPTFYDMILAIPRG